MDVWYLMDEPNERLLRSPDGRFYKGASASDIEAIIESMRVQGVDVSNLQPIKAKRHCLKVPAVH